MVAPEKTHTFPFAGSSYRGPSPLFDALRKDAPVTRVRTAGGVDAWVVSRYQDIREALADERLSRAATCTPDAPRVGGAMYTTPEMIISMDHPEHSRLRKLVAGAFTQRRVERMRDRVQEVVDELLDAMATTGSPADLVQSLALPMPLTVIGDLLGVPREELMTFERAARTFATVDERAGGDAALRGLKMLNDYIVDLIARKRREPAEDMLSELIAARDDQDRLSEQELVTFGFTLIGAGFDTTACQLGNSVLALIEHHRDQWDRLVADPGLVPLAVEELLRRVNLFATDTTGFHRIAIADLEIGNVRIPAGDVVLLALSSANRDESIFENADQLDLGREHNPHLSFGHGVHYCLGKHLGRMEMQIAIDGLVRRFPKLRLAVPESELPWHFGEINHMLIGLPVAW